ncbi:MAG: hypothetical protein A2W72_12530 [Burkholderiales bacterium RIFCSPLOWO2_12_67_14]|nr:MAG: hypothetical protein A3I64_15255 [Burkholderiales bacterium RIFCSPLOWO2_02_FULL_67_64]OGB42448.1 MAG: hypothetical protein A2W72_12530 [Burkholderiales bacterium RIFCSPLOWO2_12_67_14]OGB44327.1 MAG: hypothetical protein A3E51_01320 [Burkholderiales bacterium RIFCSPHIGHO2_12_FULL_67_38]OGB93821.1 MAG: hypothetical protein A3G82_12905 [Burkholderiales bacterium RIFCSPLOWO2_12_FULL_67_210]
MNIPFKSRTLAKGVIVGALLGALVACGGGSDTSDNDAVPTGGALSNLWFADSDGYFPLDKLKPNGSFYQGTEADFGLKNPAYNPSTKTHSLWAIDTSASVPAGTSLNYAMKIDAISASAEAVAELAKNLQLDTTTGLITQTCKGYPECYDNTGSTDEDFLITVTAQVVGGSGKLERNFLLRVRGNN